MKKHFYAYIQNSFTNEDGTSRQYCGFDTINERNEFCEESDNFEIITTGHEYSNELNSAIKNNEINWL